MPAAVAVTIIVVLVALAGALVPLLVQLRRTAKVLDAFLVSSGRDLSQLAEDVHASRLRMDRLATSLQTSLDELSVFTSGLSEAGRTLKALNTRVQTTIGSASRIFEGVLGGAGAVLATFKHKHHSKPVPENKP